MLYIYVLVLYEIQEEELLFFSKIKQFNKLG